MAFEQFLNLSPGGLTARVTGGGWVWIHLRNGKTQSQNQLILTV
jgi:hypothetical protein